MICKIKHFHEANKTTKAKNLNKKSFQRKKSANKYENLIKNVTKQAEARRAKTKSVNVHCAVVATDSDSQFAFNQSLCMAAIDLDPCVHPPKINKIRDRNHFNVLLNPSLCVLRLSLLRLICVWTSIVREISFSLPSEKTFPFFHLTRKV